MISHLIDYWEDKRALMGEKGKRVMEFDVDANRAFPNAKSSSSIEEFCILANDALNDPSFFDPPKDYDPVIVRDEDFIHFPANAIFEFPQSNTVWAKITESKSRKQVLLVLHHWGATKRNSLFAKLIAKSGITVVEMALPYHLERSRTDKDDSEYFVSPNLGRTIQAVQQSVIEARQIVKWLNNQGYEEIFLLGISIGSLVGGLLTAHERAITKSALFMTAGDIAASVWTSCATRLVKTALIPNLNLSQLQKAWAPINSENYAKKLARPNLNIFFVLAKRDKVILPERSESLIEKLISAKAKLKITRLNCGHYSLGNLPFSLIVAYKLLRFLKSKPQCARFTTHQN